MTQPTASTPTTITLRLPSALVLGLGFDPTAGLERSGLGEMPPPTGPIPLDPGWVAFLPGAGEPAALDRAAAWAATCLTGSGGDHRVLVLPGEVAIGDGAVRRVADVLQDDLTREPPAHGADRLLITTRAAIGLERQRQLGERFSYRGPSGRTVSVASLGPPGAARHPWRNPELLERPTVWIERQDLTRRVVETLRVPACRVQGPLGVGKTRLLHRVLSGRAAPYLRTSILPQPDGTAAPLTQRLGAQLLAGGTDAPFHRALAADPELRQLALSLVSGKVEGIAPLLRLLALLAESLGEAPIWVVDDAETLAVSDLKLLAELASRVETQGGFRLAVVGRPDDRVNDLDHLPTLTVPTWGDGELLTLADQLTAELSLPRDLQERLLGWVRGNPLALEESLAALLHSRQVKQVYGSFVFSGDEALDFEPSQRWTRHVVSEAFRLDALHPLLALAAASEAAPPRELRSAASLAGGSASARWDEAVSRAGLLESTDSPWGDAVTISCPAVAGALRSILSEPSREALRRQLGELLSSLGRAASGQRVAWQLVAGSPTGARLATELARRPADELRGDHLARMLTVELESLRRRGGDEAAEFDLLWQLLRRGHGTDEEIDQHFRRAAELAQESPRRRLALALLRAEHAQRTGDLAAAATALRTALRLVNEAPERQIQLLIQLGRLELRRERFGTARDLFRRLLDALPIAAPDARAACRFQLGNLLLHAGRPWEALQMHRHVLEQQSDDAATAASLCAIGSAHLAIGNHPEALQAYHDALAKLEEDGSVEDRAIALRGLGRALGRIGDFTAATKPLRTSVTLLEERRDRTGSAMSRLALAANLLELDHPEAAEREALEAAFHLRMTGSRRLHADAEQLLGAIQLRRRAPEIAVEHLERALAAHRELGDAPGVSLDLALMLDGVLSRGVVSEVRRLASTLSAAIDPDRPQDLKQRLDFQLHRAWLWLQERGVPDADPQLPLARAYTELMRQAGQLEPEARHRFLHQIPVHAAIVEAAAHRPRGAD